MASQADTAVVSIMPVPGTADSGVRGTVVFVQPRDSDRVAVQVRLTGLAPGKHGLHIHALGDLTHGCTSAGGHFNPSNAPHGGPADDAAHRHVGDLGNVTADAAGAVVVDLVDSMISLRGPHSIIGRSVVIHADEDDLGRGGQSDSLTTGHAGARVGCGVIGIGAERAL